VVFSLAILAAFAYPLVKLLLKILLGLMFLTTLWLLYLQAFVIHHFCQYCPTVRSRHHRSDANCFSVKHAKNDRVIFAARANYRQLATSKFWLIISDFNSTVRKESV
jgi:hypothetical protein